MPRAYLPELDKPPTPPKPRVWYSPDDRMDYEPENMLPLDNSKQNNRTAAPCKFAPTCFQCPLAKCKYDFPFSSGTITHALRRKDTIIEVGRRYMAGESPYRIAVNMDIYNNHIYRWVKNKVWEIFPEWNSSTG